MGRSILRRVCLQVAITVVMAASFGMIPYVRGIAYAAAVSSSELISKSASGQESDQGTSSYSRISDNGRYVAYMSTSGNLGGQRPDVPALYVYDHTTQTTTLASVDSDGVQEDGILNYFDLSGDGRHVVFITNAHNMDSNAGGDLARWSVYVRDLDTGITTLASVNASGQRQYVSSNTWVGFVSDTARFIVYQGMDIVDDNYMYTPYLRDMTTSQAQALPISDGQNYLISRDGSSILYWRPSDSSPELYDVASGQIKTVRFNANGSDYTGDQSWPMGISQDGSHVLLEAYQCSTPTINSCLLYSDLAARTTVEIDDPDVGGTVSFADASFSSDGQDIAYSLSDTSDGKTSLYVYSLATGQRSLVFRDASGSYPIKASSISGDGSGVTYIEGSSSLGVTHEQIFANTLTWSGVPVSITSAASYSTSIRQPITPAQFTATTTALSVPNISESGALPAGLSFSDNGDGTANFVGEAAVGTAGTYPITIMADDGDGSPATQSFVLTITNATLAPGFVSANSDTETFGVPFSFTVVTSGYPVPTITKMGTLPGGVTFTSNGDGTATIAGTPTAASVGVRTITLKAKAGTVSATQSFTLSITSTPTFKSISKQSATGAAGDTFSLVVSAKGYTIPTISESGILPAGLAFSDNGNGTATFAGTPEVGSGGSYPITLSATNSNGTATKAITLYVNEVPVITSRSSATASPLNAFSFQVTATGYPVPKFSLTGTLPAGLVFHTGSGVISGTPHAGTNGTYPLSISATNSSGVATQSFTLSVSSPQ